jgi:hypothetical protein
MNGVEAAASLFGSEEPASDPFAALGEPQFSHEDPFSVASASYLSHSGATSQQSNISLESATYLPQESSLQGHYPQNSNFTGGYTPDLGAESGSHQGCYSDSTYHVPEPALNGKVIFFETTFLFLIGNNRTAFAQQ